MRNLFIYFAILTFTCLSGLSQNLRLGFPQVAVGGTITTIVDLTNKGTDTFSGSLAVITSDAFFMDVVINGTPINDFFNLVIPPGQVKRLELTAQGTALRVGHILIWDNQPQGGSSFNLDAQVDGTLIFQLFDGSTMIDSIGVSAAGFRESFFFIAEVNADANTGLALSNPFEEDTLVTIRAISGSGQFVDGRSFELQGFHHDAFFINEKLSLPNGFHGTIEVETDQAVFAVALRQENVQLSTIQVSDLQSVFDVSLNLNDGRTVNGEMIFQISELLIVGVIRFSNYNLDGNAGILTGLATEGIVAGTIIGASNSQEVVITVLSTSMKTTLNSITAAVTVREGSKVTGGTLFGTKRK